MKKTTDYNAIVRAPCATLGIVHNGDSLSSVDFVDDTLPECNDGHLLTLQAVGALNAYFKNALHPFSLSLSTPGTAFQQRVWAALRLINVGKTTTYGELAVMLGSGPRAVAAACRANPLPIIVPCHRVVASNGLGGYSGARSGLLFDVKPWLLRHEGALTV